MRSPYGSSPFTAIPGSFSAGGEVFPEESRLGGEVRFHVAVEIEVVPAEVREDPHVEPDPLDSSLRGAVGRHLHQQIGGPVGDGLGPSPSWSSWGTAWSTPFGDRAAHPVIDRADHRGDAPGRPQDRLDQVRDRRLPVGPRDARHPQHRGRIAVERNGHPRPAPPSWRERARPAGGGREARAPPGPPPRRRAPPRKDTRGRRCGRRERQRTGRRAARSANRR